MLKEQRQTNLSIAAEVYVLFVRRTVTSYQASCLLDLYYDNERNYLFVVWTLQDSSACPVTMLITIIIVLYFLIEGDTFLNW
jgi:hypothetical protein